MASSMAQVLAASVVLTRKICSPFTIIIRNSSKPPKKKQKKGTIKHRNLIASACESLAARGFLRSYKPYTPDANVTEKVLNICERVLGPNYETEGILSRENKFTILNTCFTELKHSVPNSLLHKINNVSNIVEFYETPVITTNPFDEFQNKTLPPNLHIQYDYVRFNGDTDTKFKGITAFPESSTIVTGLKEKTKYKGYKADCPDIYDNRPIYEKEGWYE